MKPKNLLLLLMLTHVALGDVLHIEPYAQWTFDQAFDRVIYRDSAIGFPIMFTITDNQITYYDSLGNDVKQVDRTDHDIFKLSENHAYFMLIQEHESILATNPQLLYSFQVYNFKGEPQYTLVHGVDLESGHLQSTLTNQGDVLLTQENQSWLLELNDADTLLYIEDVFSSEHHDCEKKVVQDRLMNRNEMITAATCSSDQVPDSVAIVELQLWNHNQRQGDVVEIPGRLAGLEVLPRSDYYFLEIDDGYASTLTLFNRDNILGHFPWKTWDIRSLGAHTAFVISENDLNVVNLGDGKIISSFHPVDIANISDAEYLPEWGLFLYIRFESFYTDTGQQGYRKFELEGVSKTGQIAHRSSFGSWTPALPKLSQIGKDLFAIHMYNAVLLYRVGLEEK